MLNKFLSILIFDLFFDRLSHNKIPSKLQKLYISYNTSGQPSLGLLSILPSIELLRIKNRIVLLIISKSIHVKLFIDDLLCLLWLLFNIFKTGQLSMLSSYLIENPYILLSIFLIFYEYLSCWTCFRQLVVEWTFSLGCIVFKIMMTFAKKKARV